MNQVFYLFILSFFLTCITVIVATYFLLRGPQRCGCGTKFIQRTFGRNVFIICPKCLSSTEHYEHGQRPPVESRL